VGLTKGPKSDSIIRLIPLSVIPLSGAHCIWKLYKNKFYFKKIFQSQKKIITTVKNIALKTDFNKTRDKWSGEKVLNGFVSSFVLLRILSFESELAVSLFF
jgi:hypothetical protein